MMDENAYWELSHFFKRNYNQEDQELFLIAEIERNAPEE
jgi:hypothetical protein